MKYRLVQAGFVCLGEGDSPRAAAEDAERYCQGVRFCIEGEDQPCAFDIPNGFRIDWAHDCTWKNRPRVNHGESMVIDENHEDWDMYAPES